MTRLFNDQAAPCDGELAQIAREHRALLRAHGRAQARCSEALHAQAREIDRLNAQVMRLRAEVMLRDTALMWARGAQDEHFEPDLLEDSLHAADLVICQTGCLSHGAYWRVQDHCKRTGKPCVLVAQPQALRIARIHKAPGGGGQARIATLQPEAKP